MPPSTKITFYDLICSHPEKRSTSPFTSKLRYILNYKQLNYTTQWLQLGEIEPLFKNLGMQHTAIMEDGSLKYTVPAIIDETDTSKAPVLISDSYEIAKYLEQTYPDPERAVFPAFPLNTGAQQIAPAMHALVEKHFYTTIYPVLRGFVMWGIWKAQTDGSRDVWLSRVGGDVANIPRVPATGSKERADAMKKLQDVFKGLGDVIGQNTEGIWFMGSKPTYADFVLLATLMLLKSHGEIGRASGRERVSQLV